MNKTAQKLQNTGLFSTQMIDSVKKIPASKERAIRDHIGKSKSILKLKYVDFLYINRFFRDFFRMEDNEIVFFEMYFSEEDFDAGTGYFAVPLATLREFFDLKSAIGFVGIAVYSEETGFLLVDENWDDGTGAGSFWLMIEDASSSARSKYEIFATKKQIQRL